MKFSFIVPAYNAEKTIDKCLNSILSQTYHNWEVIVVDDGSRDNTWHKLQEYSQKDARIRAFTHANRGPGLTRNAAIEKAVGDYFCFVDSDDYIEKDYLECVSALINRDHCDVVILDNYYEDSNGKLIREERLSQFKNLNKEDLIAVQMTGKMPWGGWRKIICAKIIRDHALAYSNDPVGEEALFSFQVFYYAQNIRFLEKPVVHYVDYPNSQSKKGDDDPWGSVAIRLKNYLAEHGLADKYRKQINSFAATALVVSLYRISSSNGFFRAVAECRKRIRIYKDMWSFDVYPLSLETRVKILLWFVKIGIVTPIVLSSKIKNILK